MRAGRGGIATYSIANTGANDAFVPVVWADIPDGFSASLTVDGDGAGGDILLDLPPTEGSEQRRMLAPGERVDVPVYLTAPLEDGNYAIALDLYTVPWDPVGETYLALPDPPWAGEGLVRDPVSLSWPAKGLPSHTLTGVQPQYIGSATQAFKDTLTAEFPQDDNPETSDPGDGWKFTYMDWPATFDTSSEYEVWHDKHLVGANFIVHEHSAWIQTVKMR